MRYSVLGLFAGFVARFAIIGIAVRLLAMIHLNVRKVRMVRMMRMVTRVGEGAG